MAILPQCVVLLLLLAASSSPARVHGEGAVLVTTNGSGGRDTLNKWAASRRFHVGDTMDFHAWGGPVLLVRRVGYETCAAAGSLLMRFADGGKTSTRITLQEPGVMYFIAGSTAPCEAGLRMAVRVAPRYHPTDAPDQNLVPGTEASDDKPTVAPRNVARRLLPAASVSADARHLVIGGGLLASSSPSPSPVGQTPQAETWGASSRSRNSHKSAIILAVCFAVFLVLVMLCVIYFNERSEQRRSRASAPVVIAPVIAQVPEREVELGNITSAIFSVEEEGECEYKEGGGRACEICVQDYENGDRLGVLPCKHKFHALCIKEWIRVGVQPNCPLCGLMVV